MQSSAGQKKKGGSDQEEGLTAAKGDGIRDQVQLRTDSKAI